MNADWETRRRVTCDASDQPEPWSRVGAQDQEALAGGRVKVTADDRDASEECGRG